MSASPTPHSNFQNWLRLLQFLKPYRVRFAGGILLGMLSALLTAVLVQGVPIILNCVFPTAGVASNVPGQSALLNSTQFGKVNVAAIIVQGVVHFWQSTFGVRPNSIITVVATLLLVPLIMIGRAFCDYTSNYFLNWVGVRIITDIRQRVFVYVQGLSLDFFNKSNVGDLISRLVSDCQQAQSAITTVIADSIKQPFTIIAMSYVLLSADWKFSLAAVLLAPLCILPIAIYGRKVRRTSKLSQENQGEILSRLHENLTGVRVVKAFHMEEYEKRKFWETCYRQFAYQMRIVRSVNILSPLIELIAAIGVTVALYSAYRRQIPVGNFLGLITGIYFLYNPIKNLSKLHTTIQKSLASTDRVFAVLDARRTVTEKAAARELAPIRNQIQFRDVSFRYDAKWVLQNIDLTIPHGQTYAIVGPSGAGKTTLMNLILRFYDPTQGRVLVDGVDIREITFLSLRQQMAIVTQETILFNDTIRNNIRYGSMSASDVQVEEAARRAHAHEFILHQPHQYDTVVGEKGVKLSGGQKQRLAIARAILKNPAILLLDEATSALDTESERLVQEALDELIRGRTVVVIAHRLSTVQRADRIIVLDRGRIIEQGRHEDLLNDGKLYRRLYDLQFQSVMETG